MEKKQKNIYLVVAFGVALFVCLTNLSVVFRAVANLFTVLLPVMVGLILAFVLNVPVAGCQKILKKIFPKISPKASRPIGLLLTLLLLSGLLVLLGVLLVPELVSAVTGIINKVEVAWPRWMQGLERMVGRESAVMDWLNSLNLEEMLTQVVTGAGTVLDSVVGVTVGAVSSVSTAVIGLIIAFYVLLSKDTLGRQIKRLLLAYCGETTTGRVCKVSNLFGSTYSKFLSGQCLEALILGVLIYLVFTIFHLPNALVVAVISVFCAFIPYVGAFVSCLTAGFLALLFDPQLALWCVLTYIAVQFVETQFIYPHVVGNSIGLSALWTLLAVLVGGSLFGFLGILFFIPLVAVLYELLREAVNAKLAKKQAIEEKRQEALEKLKNAKEE